ncbi:max dimerization protein 4 isoform X2 [Heterocephalus glaber]|uniref:Max dimerization protein 4 isoform X2 n=1 Tax=Heterocephalus glaber TaxID=10181 RepID=A0AAX6T270_HETGA|nr:max dimerization protein 4 isoform X2 [Heterocephalus glaber]
MELNSLLLLLEAAEYLERRDREAEHGYASVLPFDGDFARKKTKAAGLVRKAPNNRSSHNELEKHRPLSTVLYLPRRCARVLYRGRSVLTRKPQGWDTAPGPRKPQRCRATALSWPLLLPETSQAQTLPGAAEAAGASGPRQHAPHHTEPPKACQDAHQETGGAGSPGTEHQGAAAAGASLPEAAPGAAVGAEHGACAHGQHRLRCLHR